jgi:hypothetical protein
LFELSPDLSAYVARSGIFVKKGHGERAG